MTAPAEKSRFSSQAILLAAFAGVSLLVLGFGLLTSEILEGDTQHADTWALHVFRDASDLSRPIGPAWFTVAMIDITALGSTTILTLATLLVTGFLLLIGKTRTALLITSSIGAAALLKNALKAVIERPRPDTALHLVDVSSASYPSGHAMLSAIVYLTIAMLLARVIKNRTARIFVVGAAILFVILIGFSRVYLGVHYPTDVIAGWCAGAAWAGASFLIATRISRRNAP